MASKKQVSLRKKELIAQLATNRQSISRGREVLKEKLQVKKQLRKFIVKKPKAIFAGSLVAGLAATILLRRPRKVKKSSKTTQQILLGWGLSLIKPALKAWILTRVKKIATERITTRVQKEETLDTW